MLLPADVLALARVEPVPAAAGVTARPYAGLRDEALEQLVARLGRRLGTPERRTAAATLHLGLAGRLWSLILGGSLRAGAVPELAGLRWWDEQGSVRLHLPAEVAVHGQPPLAYVLDLLHPLSRTLAGGLARGNVASSLVSTARLLGHPDAARDLLADPALAGALDETGRRRSCCLFVRVPGGGLCGDCSLRPAR